MADEISKLPPIFSGEQLNTKIAVQMNLKESAPVLESTPLEFSKAIIALQNSVDQIKTATVVDTEKVNLYREAIANGSYAINARSIAERLLNLDHYF